MWAVERQKDCVTACFLLGWLFGTGFFFGTCWWLTYAPIHYASFPPLLAYFLLFCVTAVAGLFPGIFAAILSILLRRFGSRAFLAAPFAWVACEFARYWITGNNWNAIAYSQACEPLCSLIPILWLVPGVWTAAIGGVLFTTGIIVFANTMILRTFYNLAAWGEFGRKVKWCIAEWMTLFVLSLTASFIHISSMQYRRPDGAGGALIALQPNVPMSGLDSSKWNQLRQRQIDLAEVEIREILDARKEYNERQIAKGLPQLTDGEPPLTVILPESPMNFMYSDDQEFQQFIGDFARRNNVSVLFNSSEPDETNGKYFNSAVMVGPAGNKIAQYDKIYLLPFGEAVPGPLERLVPAFVGNFSQGREYDLLSLGEAKVGVMICFESHFGQLSREYVRNGADVIIEMTNDGYLGPTPVLRQHLANAIFRAVETNRPVLRITNVGITVRVHPNGDICDSLIWCGPEPYTEDVHGFSVSKSDGSQTFYVKYGDWFAWLCTIITLGLLGYAVFRRKIQPV